MTDATNIVSAVADAAPAGHPDAAEPVRVEVVTSFGDGGIDPAEWNGLLERSGGSVYGTHEWQSAWWSCFGGGRALRILRFSAAGGVIAIVPLFLERAGGTGRLRLIGSGEAYSKSGGRLLDDGPGDYLDFIVDPAHAGMAASAFWSWLESATTVGRVDLVNLRDDGAFLREVLPAMPAGRFAIATREADRCPFIPVEGDAAAFLRSLRGSARRRYGQAFRLVDPAEAPLRRLDDDPDSLPRVFDDLVRLHQERWNALGFTGLFHDQARLRFHRMVAERFAARGWVRYASLYDGPDCVAARIGFVFRGRMYDYLSGFDESARIAARRPGLGLLVALYAAAHREGLGQLDLLRGDEAYKFELTAQAARNRNVTIERPGAAGRVFGAVAAGLEMAGFLLGREAALYSVQAARHGALGAIPRYIGFRTSRFRKRTRPASQIPAETKGETQA